MSATMTTSQRGIPAVSIAPSQTQNTAPVYEFECLFTHDLRKKKKTWHDGSLRFHTFNRRVMVYDDSKNFVGDLHYRDADELGEGDELRLDKGVLVDVGRRIGQTDTDLTEVLDRGRHGDGGAQATQAVPAATYQSMQRVAFTNTQGRPKSLAAVLGASQGPIGRARLAIESPYERLHRARAIPLQKEPPMKKQRLMTDKENLPALPKAVRHAQLHKSARLPPKAPAASKTPLAVRKETNAEKAVYELSSDDDSAQSPTFSSAFGSSRSRQKGTSAMRNPPAKLDLALKTARPKQSLHSNAVKPSEAPRAPTRVPDKLRQSPNPAASVEAANELRKVQRGQKTAANTKPPTCNASPSSNVQGRQKASVLPGPSARAARASSGPTSSLRFARQKPRPKLIYRDLLPPSFVASRPSSSNSARSGSLQPEHPIKTKQRNTRAPAGESRSGTYPGRDVFDISSPESILSQRQQAPVLAEPLTGQTSSSPAKAAATSPSKAPAKLPVHQASSPLFVTQSPKGPLLAANNSEDDDLIHSPIKTPQQAQLVEAEQSIDNALLEDTPMARDKPNSASPVSRLTLMDQPLMMLPLRAEQPLPPAPQSSPLMSRPPAPVVRSSVNQGATTPQTRHLRRVLSESNSPAVLNATLVVSPPGRIPSALNSMRHRNKATAPESRQPFRSPAKFQRAYSDTSAMLQIEMQRPIGKVSVNVPKMVQAEKDGDSGPWSSKEAFLLFDWWPPGRKRPEYDRDAEGFVRPQSIHRDGPDLVGFQSAWVIRDGMDI